MEGVVIAGIGETAYRSRTEETEAQLAAIAVQRALDDAGVEAASIDGIIANPSGLAADDVISAFRLGIRFAATANLGGASMVASLQLAAAALRSGEANAVLVFIARRGSSGSRIADRAAHLPGQFFRTQLEHPYGWSTPAQWYAVICRRHMDRYGTTKRQLAEVALTMRRHGQLNDRAQLHDRPLTLEAYEAAPVIADPYQLYDCCLETDGAAAVIVTTADRAHRAAGRAIELAACAVARPESPDDLSNRADWFRIGLSDAAPRAFAEAGLGPSDMDAAMIYDCFTFEVLHQLEEAGFCRPGESGEFVVAGHISLDGKLPVNTHGGLLAEGHLNGLNHVIEGVRQLRGEAGHRQLPRVRHLAVTGWGNLGDGALAVLRRPGA